MKKRFELFDTKTYCWIEDHETKKNYSEYDFDCLTDFLNEQNEQIKALEKYKSKYIDCLDKQLERENITHGLLLETKAILNNLEKENRQLKQSQNDRAIKILENVKFVCESSIDFATEDQKEVLCECISTQIKELKDEKRKWKTYIK